MITKEDIEKNRKVRLVSVLAVIVVMIIFATLALTGKLSIIGLQILGEENLTSHEQSVSWIIASDSEMQWEMEEYPAEFNLRSMKLDGELLGDGLVRAYLVTEEKEYLIIDSSRIDTASSNTITGMVVGVGNDTEGLPAIPVEEITQENQTEQEPVIKIPEEPASEKQINIDLAYQSGTRWDANDDGTAYTRADAVDFTVHETSFNWEADQDKLCTRWVITSLTTGIATTVCNGAADCCALSGVAPTETSWDSSLYIYYEQYGTTLENEVTAQVIYLNQSLEEGDVHFDSVQSETVTLDANFEEAPQAEFSDICVQTCTLPKGINSTEYTIRFEVETGTLLKVNKIKYAVEDLTQGIAETPTTVDTKVKDAKGRVLASSIEFEEKGTGNKVKKENLAKGKYKVKINFTEPGLKVKKIEFDDMTVFGNTTEFVRVDDVEETGDLSGYAEVYAIDPTSVNFTTATVTVLATGTQLYKCKEWDFDAQSCDGTWELFKTNIIPGEEYTFTLTPDDPGFAEINISDAEHLDANYALISNMYADVRSLDSIWSESINEDEYVRVTFEQNLTDGNIIDIYYRNPKGKNTWIEVYKAGTTAPILGVSGILDKTGGWDYIRIRNITQDTNKFDFKIVDSEASPTYLEFDYIHDAVRSLDDTAFTANMTTVKEGSNIKILATYRIGNGGAPTLPWVVGLNATNNGKKINATCYAGAVMRVINISQACAAATPCTYNSTSGTMTVPAAHPQNTDMPVNWTVQACSGSAIYSPARIGDYIVSLDTAAGAGATIDLMTENVTINSTAAPINSTPPGNTITELGNATQLYWNLTGNGGFYNVTRNGTLVEINKPWSGPSTRVIVSPNVYFLGDWNYTLYFSETGGGKSNSSTLLSVVDTQFPSCSASTTGSGDILAPTLKSISIDGDMSDWDAILANPNNYVTDLTEQTGDPDDIQTSDRDMTVFTYTYDPTYLYFYYHRTYSGSRQVSMIVYLDYNLDGYMKSTDKVVKFVWSGTNRQYDADLYDYVPVNGVTGDLMQGDGYDMPGAIANPRSLESNVLGGSVLGTELETRVKWSDMSFSSPGAINFKAAAGRGSATNLPSQLEDNVGDVLITESSYFTFTPGDQEKATKNGTTTYYTYDVRNCGNAPTTLDLLKTSTQGWNITFYYPYSSQTPLTDTSGSGYPDITLAGNQYTTLIIKVDVPSGAALGLRDIANISLNNSEQSSFVIATTIVSDIAITPSLRQSSGAQGMLMSYNFTVYNYQNIADTLEMTLSSNNSWPTAAYYANGTQLTDTDSDGRADTGYFLSGQSKDIIIRVTIPGSATAGMLDNTTIRINSSVTPTNNVVSQAVTQVKGRLIFTPLSYNRTVNSDTRQYFEFNITNNWNTTEYIEVNSTSTQGWNTSYVDFLRTPFTDHDGDGNADIVLPPYGGTATFYVKVLVPQDTQMGVSEITTFYVNSSTNTSLFFTAKINETPRGVALYNDSGRTNLQYIYEVDAPVYGRAFYLDGYTTVYMTWYDGFNFTRTSPDITVTGQGTADDWVQTNKTLGVYYWTVTVYNADDDSEITRNQFLVTDPVKPNLTAILPVPGSTVGTGGKIEVKANATDNVYINYVEANIAYPNGTNYTLYLEPAGGINYSNNFTAPNLLGRYNITYYAYDLFGHVNDTETSYFTVYDATPPSVFGLKPIGGSQYGYGATVEIAANVTDNIQVSTVIAQIQYPNGTLANFTLTPTIGAKYNTSFVTPSIPGAYQVRIFANDTSGNWNSTVTTSFTVNAPAPTYPTVNLNGPTNAYSTPNSTVTFNWTATSNQYGSMLCNLTVDGVVNASNVLTLNNTPTTRTISNFSETTHNWNVTCWGQTGYTTTSATRNFTVNIVTPTLLAFSVTLPGKGPVNASEGGNATAAMDFNVSLNTYYGMEACVQGTNDCQNSSTPFFNYLNTGNVNLTLNIKLDSALPPVFNLRANILYNNATASNVTTTPLLLATDIAPGGTLDTWFFGDFINAYPDNSTTRNLYTNGTQS
ncbi:MAG: hypothetical protein V1729_03315 [Candidatus Woesearchaeota archaeon]